MSRKIAFKTLGCRLNQYETDAIASQFDGAGYELVDLTFASCILRDKLRTEYANGDILKAIQLYKGGKNQEALRYAKNVMKIYKEIEPKLT